MLHLVTYYSTLRKAAYVFPVRVTGHRIGREQAGGQNAVVLLGIVTCLEEEAVLRRRPVVVAFIEERVD